MAHITKQDSRTLSNSQKNTGKGMVYLLILDNFEK